MKICGFAQGIAAAAAAAEAAAKIAAANDAAAAAQEAAAKALAAAEIEKEKEKEKVGRNEADDGDAARGRSHPSEGERAGEAAKAREPDESDEIFDEVRENTSLFVASLLSAAVDTSWFMWPKRRVNHVIEWHKTVVWSESAARSVPRCSYGGDGVKPVPQYPSLPPAANQNVAVALGGTTASRDQLFLGLVRYDSAWAWYCCACVATIYFSGLLLTLVPDNAVRYSTVESSVSRMKKP